MLIDAQLQRFQTRQRYPGVEWGQSSAGIAQDARACLERECWCAQIGVLETVVCGIWGDKVGEDWLAVAFHGPVELAAVDNNATHGRAIARVELGGGCDDDIRAEFQRTGNCRGSDRVVHD